MATEIHTIAVPLVQACECWPMRVSWNSTVSDTVWRSMPKPVRSNRLITLSFLFPLTFIQFDLSSTGDASLQTELSLSAELLGTEPL